MSLNSKRKILALVRARGRAAALATPLPNRQSKPLAKPAPRPSTNLRLAQPPEVTHGPVLDATAQTAISQPTHPADPTAESAGSSNGTIFGAAGEQVEMANQLAARTEQQAPIAPIFVAYVHAATTTVRAMQQLGQLWMEFAQASIRRSAVMAFEWTMRR